MKKVLCFGEILLRLSPDLDGSWLSTASMPVYIGGAELNVAQALARWKVPVAYCSAIPDNYMSRGIIAQLQKVQVDTSRMVTSGDRLGIYYLAQGTDLKNAEVIYDRANSSTATLKKGQLDWDFILDGISWFHFSAISPALNEEVTKLCKEGLEAAEKKGIFISVDLNYRSKLWKWGKSPYEVMPDLVQHCDLVMGNIWAAETMLGIQIDEELDKSKKQYVAQAEKTSKQIIDRFPKCTQVANTFRFDMGESLQYYGTYYTDQRLFVSKEHTVKGIRDKVGSGDCFMGGLIYGNVNELGSQQTIEYAAAAAVDKMYIVGDATTSPADKIFQRLL